MDLQGLKEFKLTLESMTTELATDNGVQTAIFLDLTYVLVKLRKEIERLENIANEHVLKLLDANQHEYNLRTARLKV